MLAVTHNLLNLIFYMESTTTSHVQKFTGVVVKTSGQQTVAVRVDRYVKHPKYKKYQVRSKTYLVHDPEQVAQIGDTVTIVSCRPVSKTKRFVISPK